MRKSESETEKVSEGGTWTGGGRGEGGGKRVKRRRFGLLERGYRGCLNETEKKRKERERERDYREEKRRYKERGNRTRRVGALRGEEEGRKAGLATLQAATLHTTWWPL